jgi:hypothetical protein
MRALRDHGFRKRQAHATLRVAARDATQHNGLGAERDYRIGSRPHECVIEDAENSAQSEGHERTQVTGMTFDACASGERKSWGDLL